MQSIDKSKLIEAVRLTEDERILFAITRLLQLEEAPQYNQEKQDKGTRNIDVKNNNGEVK